MSDRWAVATCPECESVLLIDRKPTTGALTIECGCGARLERHPRAGSDYTIPRVHTTAETRPEAVEQRGRLLANRWTGDTSSLYREFDGIDTGAEAAEAAEARLAQLTQPFADKADSAVEQYAGALEDEATRALSRWDDVLSDEADAYLSRARWRQVFADAVDDDTGDDRWAEAAEAALDRHDADPEGEPDPGPQRGSLVLSSQRGVTATAEVTLSETFSEVWQALVDETAVQQAFLRSIRELAAGRTVPELFDECARLGLRPELQSWVVDIARGHHRRAWAFCHDLLPKLGTDIGRRADQRALGRLLRHNDRALDLGVRVPASFRDLRRDDREAMLEFVVDASQGLDVKLVATGRMQRWLLSDHDETIPARASADCIDSRESRPDEAAVECAVDTLDPDARPVEILRALRAQPAETLAYVELYERFSDVSAGAVRQSLGTLADDDCISRTGPDRSKRVQLTATGATVLDRLDELYGRQSELPTGVSESDKFRPQAVYPAQGREGGKAPSPGESAESSYYFSGWLSSEWHAGIAGAAPTGQISTLKDNPETSEDGNAPLNRFRGVSYDDDREEVAISVPAGSPLQMAVSSALALATPWFLQRLFENRSLDPADSEGLRAARCIGALSDDALEDMETLRGALVEWGETISENTRKLQNPEDHDITNRGEFRGQILRNAKGLAGSIVHLLDHLDVTVRRELRVPTKLSQKQLSELAFSIAHSVAIESNYRGYAAFRQLFESRPDKRAGALEADVDASDPRGDYIGGLVLRGGDIHRLVDYLEEEVAAPLPVHEEAPELAISVTIDEVGRAATATAANRIASAKRLTLSRPVVSLLDALVTPTAAASALQALEAESTHRDIRPDELRYGLATLPPSELLPEAPPSVGKMLSALLRADRPLSKSELAEDADISNSSVGTYDDYLIALGLMAETEAGYRFALSFRDERGDRVLPDIVEEAATLADIAARLLETHLPADRYGDPTDDVGGLLFWPPNPRPLLDHEDFGPWMAVAVRCLDATETEPAEVEMGGPTAQVPVQKFSATPTAGD